MDFKTYVRKPFHVTAVQVSVENMAELADMIGDGKIRKKDDGQPYFVANRQLVKTISRVEIGYWVTKMDDNFRVYKPVVFYSLFEESLELEGS